MTVKETLEAYYKVLDNAHKTYQEKYKKENPGRQGFQYDREKKTAPGEINIRNIKEQKLHIKRLIKLIEESESE